MKKLFCISAIVVLSTIVAGSARAGLLGVSVTPPVIVYANTGSLSTSYNSISQIFTVTTTPSTIKFTATEPTFSILTPRSMKISIQVDNTGALIGGVAGDDLVISGRVARIVGGVTNIYVGLLLTGEVTAFGYQDSGTVVDNYDFRFTPTGGLLLSFFECDHIGVTLVSEGSTFIGTFLTPFNGQSKGNVGLEDQIPPSITCPFENISVTNVQCSAQGAPAGAYVTFPEPTATDNCSTNVMISCSPTNGSFFALAHGTNMTSHTVNCTATDPSGNTNSCSFLVTVEDVLAPEFDSNPVIDACAEAPILLNTDPGICAATFTFEKPTAMDSCCTSAVPVGVSAIDENGFIIPLTCFTSNSIKYVTGQFPQSCLGSNVITSTANDGRGNSTQRQCAVLVFDNEPPSITCSNNQVVACTNGPVFYEEPSASDNCTNLTVSCTPSNGSYFAVGSYMVTCLAIDGCGNNTNSCSFTLTVVDITPPTISCPSNTTVECGQSTDPSSTGTATATDDCDSNPSISFNDVVSGTCPKFISRTWIAADRGGNSNQCIQVITIDDTTLPSIGCPADKQLQCGDSTDPSNTGSATGSDSCSGVAITYSDAATPANCSGKAGIDRTWKVTDDCSNAVTCVQHITFVDTTAPVVSCPGNKQLQCGDSTATNNTGAATASADNCGGPVTITYTDAATAANCTGKAGIDRTWKASDGCGNFTTCIQHITFVDTTAPVVSCPADKQLQCGDSTATNNTGVATASADNCGGPVTITYTDAATPANCTGKAGIDRTWKASDGCGNFTTCTQHITFVDTTTPTVTVPAGGNLGCNPAPLPTDASVKALVTAIDNCSTTSVTVTHVDVTVSCTTTSTFTVVVKDTCNNTTTKTVVYTYGCPPCVPFEFNFQGNTALSGAVANVRTFITNGVSVKVTAWSRVKSSGAWATAYLGSYSGGLGVTDSSEGDGSSNRHTVDNIDRDNYVLFEFSQPVVLDKAFLGYVVTDSDLSLWIGTFTDPYNNHLTLSDVVLGSFGYTETSLTNSSSTRWADVNAGAKMGNAIVVAAQTGVAETNDQFKIALFDVCAPVCQPLSLTCAASTGTKGVAYSSTLVRSGGTAPYTFTIYSGSLPPGLTLNASTGAITGTPTTAGTYTYVGKVTDSTGATAFTSSCTITIAAPMTLACVANSGQVGVYYSSTAVVSGGVSPYTFSLYSGTTPPGLGGDTNAGTLFGTPTTAGTYNFVEKVTDSTGATALSSGCTITITAPLTLACAASSGSKGVAYSSTLVASGGTPSYTFSLNSGSLPPGLTLNASSGAITGSPTTTGTYSYVAKVIDSLSRTALTSGCTITIANPCTGSICGSVWRDCDANGNLSGEAGLSNVTVQLKNSGGTVVGTTTTSTSGGYCFNTLAAGTYTVVVTLPTGYVLTAPVGCNNQQSITLSACQNKTGVDFGYRGNVPAVSLTQTVAKTSSTVLTYTFTVKNTGNTCFYGGMHVDDTMLGGQIFYQTPVTPGQSFTFTKTYTIKASDPATITNTATATGHPPTGSAVTVSSTTTIAK